MDVLGPASNCGFQLGSPRSKARICEWSTRGPAFWQGCDIAKRKIVTVDCWNVFIWNGHMSKTCQSFKQLGPNMSYKCRSLFAVHSFLDDFALSVIRTHPNPRIADLLQVGIRFRDAREPSGHAKFHVAPCAIVNGAWCDKGIWNDMADMRWFQVAWKVRSYGQWMIRPKNVLFAILGVQCFLSRLEYRHEQMWGGGCISSKIPWSFQKIPKCHECDGLIFWSSRLECVWSKLHTAPCHRASSRVRYPCPLKDF